MPVPPFPFDYALFYRPLMARVLQALRSLGFATSALDEVFSAVAEGMVQAVPPSVTPTLRMLALPPNLVGALRASPDAWLDECRMQLMAPAQQFDAADLAPLSDEELLERIVTLHERLIALTVRRFGVLAPRLVLGLTFPQLLRLAVGRDAPRLQTELLAAVPCTTTAMNQELGRLVGLIRDTPELRQVFLDAPPAQVAARLRTVTGGPALLAAVDTFLGRYGYRESARRGAQRRAWRDDPRIVYGLLKGRVVGPLETQETAALATDEEARAVRARRTLLAAARGRGWRGPVTRLLLSLTLRRLAAARALIAFREDSHFALFVAFPVIRRLALELGRRLVAQGLLADPEEIFFLAPDEITTLGAVADRQDTVREMVRRRKEARRSVAGRVTAIPVALLVQAATSGELHGAAASPGTATGPVRVIREAHAFWTLQAGEVLVAPYTSPAWTPLFALASAVVVDAGGVASHAAIVAREYGIPAVMGTGRATRVLHDGQRVLVDGTRGRVVPLAAGAAATPDH